MMKFYKLPEEQEDLEKKIKDQAQKSLKEIEERGPEMIAEISTSLATHNKCNLTDTENSGGFSILAPDGDEDMCALLLCNECKVYYLDCYHDTFFPDNDRQNFGFQQELTSEQAAIVKEAIANCQNPHRKHCRCEHHDQLGNILYKDFMEVLKQEMPKKGFGWSEEKGTWVQIGKEDTRLPEDPEGS